MKSRSTTLALIALLAAPLTTPVATFAERPASTQPSGAMRPFAGKGDPVFGRMGRRENMQNNQPPTQQEIDDTLAFIEANFPKHFELFNALPKDGPFRNRVVLPRMVQRYRQLMRLQDQNPEAYDAMLRQAQLEDVALGYARDVNNGNAKAQDDLRSTVKLMITRSIEDRRARIQKLEAALAEQTKKLAEDEKNQDQLIADQIDRTKAEYEKLFRGKDRGAVDQGDGHGPADVNALQK